MADHNGNVFENKTAPPLEKSDTASEVNKEHTFGWGKIRPKFLKFLNSPMWFMVVFSSYNFCSGVGAWGMPNLVLPSIERRFGFSAKELGVIAAANDVAAILLVVFISYYGDYGNKIRWMAGGAALQGFGILTFALPHFMIGRYHPGNSPTSNLCDHNNATMTQCAAANSGGEWYYLMVFVVAMLVMGAGNAPYFSLFPAYLDENVPPKSFPLYLGFWYFAQFMGPGAGFIIGGKFLSVYVDISQPDGFKLTPKDPRWIGAWWIGFLIFGLLIILISIIMMGFPMEMPGAKARRLEHIRQGNIKAKTSEEKPRLKRLPFEFKELLKNRTYVFNVLGLTALLFYLGTIATFLSKIYRIKFGLTGAEAGYILAITGISAAIVGNVCGSFLTRAFSLKTTCKKAAAVCVICNLLVTGMSLVFMIPACENANLVGVADQYKSNMNETRRNADFGLLKSHCNKNCGCSLRSFSPVCGSDNLTYFDSCHAGCTGRLADGTFKNCSCVFDKTSKEGGSAKRGYCDRNCKNIVIFSIIVVIASSIRTLAAVPQRTVMLRCVPENKRAFATGVGYVTYKTLGLMPSPVILGHVIDETCRLWQDTCGKKGRCLDYDVDSLSRNIAYFGLTVSMVTVLFYFLSWYFCESGNNADTAVITNKDADEEETKETRF